MCWSRPCPNIGPRKTKKFVSKFLYTACIAGHLRLFSQHQEFAPFQREYLHNNLKSIKCPFGLHTGLFKILYLKTTGSKPKFYFCYDISALLFKGNSSVCDWLISLEFSIYWPESQKNMLHFKGIVSRDFEWLQMILMNRLCVPDVPLADYSFLNILNIVFNF